MTIYEVAGLSEITSNVTYEISYLAQSIEMMLTSSSTDPPSSTIE